MHSKKLILGCALLFNLGLGNAAESLPVGCEHAAARGAMPASDADGAFPGAQLQLRVPLAPQMLASGGRRFLVYELHALNFSAEVRVVDAIDVLNASGQTMARFDQSRLDTVLRRVGTESGRSRLEGGQSAIAYLCLAFDEGVPLPSRLRHRVIVDGVAVNAGASAVDLRPAAVLARPLTGSGWSPRNGPHAGSHHRMGTLVFDGVASVSRRFALDWRITREGAIFAGDARDVRSYFAYAKKVLAVADGTVVSASDGYPDNIPKTEAGFETALPMTLASIPGNTVVLDIGGGRFVSYSHLQPGSVQVKPGQRVRRGQLLARVGNSGDSRWPHLHFQVTSSPAILSGEGVPFVLERYRIRQPGGHWKQRRHDFPWGDEAVVDFGED